MPRRSCLTLALLLALVAPVSARAQGALPLPPPPRLARATWNLSPGWRLAPTLEMGVWNDDAARDARSGGAAGAELEWRAARHHALLGELRAGWARRTYLTLPSAPGAAASRAEVAEHDYAGRLAYAYELLHHWSGAGRATAELLVGGFWRSFSNAVAPAAGAGPLAGLRVGVPLGEPLDLALEASYGYAASRSGGKSLVATQPRGVATVLAGVGVRTSGARLRLGYRLELLALEGASRRFDGLGLSLDLGL